MAEIFPYVESIANLMPVVMLAVGGVFLIRGELTMGDYVAFSGLIWAIANPMRQMGNIMNEFQRFSAASKKVMEIYYSEPKIKDALDAAAHTDHFKGKIEFREVSFQYEDGDLPVLHDISFTVKPGETIAIMGETGCGKTSLINLIPRFYEPTKGEVRIDDIPVQNFRLSDLRKQIGLATQDVLLYSDTIEGNIAYGDSSIDLEEVEKFAKYSEASDFISKMPEGYDTVVGERGVGLSGGQKQRISLARALGGAAFDSDSGRYDLCGGYGNGKTDSGSTAASGFFVYEGNYRAADFHYDDGGSDSGDAAWTDHGDGKS